jgi:hypothetical protein
LTVHRALERIRGEFLEMPGLRLTVRQVERLCGVEHTMCKAVLDALVDAKFLRLGPDGAYARLTEGEVPSQRKSQQHRSQQRHAEDVPQQ